jgi:hypothetical protein
MIIPSIFCGREDIVRAEVCVLPNWDVRLDRRRIARVPERMDIDMIVKERCEVLYD